MIAYPCLISQVLDIDRKEPAGDILVFLPGSEEIDHVCRTIKERWSGGKRNPNIWVVPLYSQLPYRAQLKVSVEVTIES